MTIHKSFEVLDKSFEPLKISYLKSACKGCTDGANLADSEELNKSHSIYDTSSFYCAKTSLIFSMLSSVKSLITKSVCDNSA